MSDEMNKYPGHEEIKEQDHAYLYDPWGNNYCRSEDVLAEFQSLLAARQRDEEMIRGLVEAANSILSYVPSQNARSDEESQTFSKWHTAINAAELRLKEGV